VIACCPECQTRYRIAREKIGSSGARLRCKKCQTVFRVEAPAEAPAAPPADVASRPRAIVAEQDPVTAKQIAEYLEQRHISPRILTSGAEALLQLFRDPPDLAVLGGHLPGLSASAIAEVVRRSGSLPRLRLIRVAPGDEAGAPPEFDAHHTLEPGDLCDGLGPLLERLGLGSPAGPAQSKVSPQAPKPAAAKPEPSTAPKPSAAPKPGAPKPKRSPVTSGDADPELAAAERLARIAISDIILYNEEKFARAVATGKVVKKLEPELAEARSMFEKRVSEKLRKQRDFLAEELQRRAEAFSG
jgi:predicted Zn finger-like uncharacterized protein